MSLFLFSRYGEIFRWNKMMSGICFQIILGGKISHKLITVRDWWGHGGTFY